MATKKSVKVVQDDEKPVSKEVLAQAIVDIAAAGKRLAAAKLNRKAVVLLLAHSSGVNRTEVGLVLDSIADLEREYLRP